MNHANVFSIVYTHTIAGRADNTRIEQAPTVSFQISKDAIASGWFKSNFPGHKRGDFAVLVAIGLHARPLDDQDLAILKKLGLAADEEKGRLYARVTDVGLADILGADRERIRDAATRLANVGLMRILRLPDNYADSRGRFAGDRAYLLDGDVLNQISDRAAFGRAAEEVRAAFSRTVSPQNAPDRAALRRTKILPSASTSGVPDGPLRGPSWSPSAPEVENRASVLANNSSGNSRDAHRAEAAAEAAIEDNRLQSHLDSFLNAIAKPKVAHAFTEWVGVIARCLGLTEAGLRSAALAMCPLPDRRRRVLDDVRRMQARADLKLSRRKNRVNAILAQNIGVTLGLGLNPDGSLRAVPSQSDYAAVGGLVGEYGAEAVWITACEIAGAAIEGDPLDYLRAALARRQNRGRDRKGEIRYGAGADIGDLTAGDYVRDLVADGAITAEQARRYGVQ